MKRNATAAIATLVRWREFQESRASATYRQCAAAAEKSQAMLVEAEAGVDDVRRYRLDLLQATRLDMARLHVASGVEDVARLNANERQAELVATRERQDSARATHVAARAQTRVAESRHARVSACESERAEKALFDWMAELRVSGRSKT